MKTLKSIFYTYNNNEMLLNEKDDRLDVETFGNNVINRRKKKETEV